MSVRIGIDLDGVLADFASSYRAIRERLIREQIAAGSASPLVAETPDEEDDEDPARAEESLAARAMRPSRADAGHGRRNDSVWERICRTENFWTTLAPIDAAVIPRLNRLVRAQRWDVFFVTRRPATAGESVQRQTHRWLAGQGFEAPSVLVVRGSRGTLAGALGLDFMIDDSQTGCVDVISDSATKAFLVLGAVPARRRSVATARKLGIWPVASAADALDAIERQAAGAASEGWLPRLSRLLRFEPRGA